MIWLAQCLLDGIGASLLSRLAGTESPLGAYVWPEWGDPGPDAAEAARVRVAYDVWKMLAPRRGDDWVVEWLMTPNPVVGRRPADAIAADDFAGVLQAAQFVRDGDALDDPDEDEEYEEEL